MSKAELVLLLKPKPLPKRLEPVAEAVGSNPTFRVQNLLYLYWNYEKNPHQIMHLDWFKWTHL